MKRTVLSFKGEQVQITQKTIAKSVYFAVKAWYNGHIKSNNGFEK